MNSEWQLTTLGEICTEQGGAIQTGPFGSQLHTSDYKEIGIPVVMPTNIGDGGISEDGIARIDQSDVDRLSQHKLMLNDIVFSRRGDVTKNALIREHEVGWFCGTGCLKVRLGTERIANAKFISHFLRLPDTKDWLVRHAVGATMPNLNTGILSAVPINLPPISVQHEIAAMLGSMDDRITLLRETNTTLEAIAQALFKSWFVDFDPVQAKMQGLAPEGMDEATAALFPDSFEESELGAVPKGWRFSNLGKSFELIMGQSPPGDTYNQSEDGLPFYQGRTDFGFRFPMKRIYCNAPTRLAEVGDALVSVRAPVGDVNMAIERCSIGRGVAAVRHLSGCIGYTFYAMKNLGTHFKNFDSEGTVFGSINKKDFESLPVVVPSQGALIAFDEISKALDGSIEINEQKIRALVEIRDNLLPRLISGQLSISEAEEALS
ncbi:restriction endonuclease subunit S [Limnohabitans sp. Bal53]|uniref:restriction endonuclease subunit S n=1 Tax=Limnohabitans sp. Bal53 TaxID=1977910 RepID=UPI000D3D8163|nr:restriction endonuclease subunit S [Limnohabitans sp. Bal53]PUE40264.1 hypothetical protein B9Z50_12475 [Limnohabitans sp. Bal53]